MVSTCKFCGVRPNRLISLLPHEAPVIDPLFQSYAAPNAHARNLAEDHLARIQKELDDLDTAISRLRQARSALEQERNKYLGLISPLRSLPPELLIQIFLAYSECWWKDMIDWHSRRELLGWHLAERRFTAQPKQLSDWALRPVRVLTQICHSWRQIVFSCPDLWTSIYLPQSSSEGELDVSRRLILDQLAHSSARPLRIRTFPPIGPFETKNHQFISRYVLPAHSRWQSIEIAITDGTMTLLPRLGEISPASGFPLLVSLSLYFIDFTIANSYTISAVDAPLLRDVSLAWSRFTAQKGRGIQLPWAQLRKLELSNCEGDHAFIIVQQLRDVEELALLGIQEYHLQPAPSQRAMTLPSLYHLRITDPRFSDSYAAAETLPFLCLPALKILTWTQMRANDKVYLDRMLEQTWPSGDYPLTELFLRSPDYNMHERSSENQHSPLVQLFRSIRPRIETLTVEYPGPSGFNLSYVVDLVVNSLWEGSIPNLHSFKLHGVLLEAGCINGLVTSLITYENLAAQLTRCALPYPDLYKDSNILFLPQQPTVGGRFVLDIEGPDSKHIVSSPESGIIIEQT